MRLRLPELGASEDSPFPPAESAWRDPNGLLAWGGGLEPERLLRAYAQGIFPWFSPGEPPLWWCPDPRMVIATDALHLSRRFRRELRKQRWTATADRDFASVIEHCARLPRRGQRGTWIVPAMRRAYIDLHQRGHAHSIEAWEDGQLIGGLYGICVGQTFFGESMFSLRSGASKFVIASLCQRLQAWDMPLLDGQVESEHLASLGFAPIPRPQFLSALQSLTTGGKGAGSWLEHFGELACSALGSD
ncbi:leucyl/phenylalanyl-tRNA--protein transferase [Aquimonas sp.]|uniref:leucyl/phenylalanyl-tRNA--protein transferase n=1 Tax=Aquimonas sp. TaxID=1872588 RepID=UPI0037BF8D8B